MKKKPRQASAHRQALTKSTRERNALIASMPFDPYREVVRLRSVIDDHDAQWRVKFQAEQSRADLAEARSRELAEMLTQLLETVNATRLSGVFATAFKLLALPLPKPPAE